MLPNHQKHATIYMSFVLLIVVVVITLGCGRSANLVGFLENISSGMTEEDVRNAIPGSFFQRAEKPEGPQLVDRVFNTNTCISSVLVYAESDGERFSDARVYFDQSGSVVAVSYVSDGFPPLPQTITNGIGPQASRLMLECCH